MKKKTHAQYNFHEHYQKAFTLVELMAVIAIISILSLIILNAVSTAKVKAEISKVQTDFHNLNQAINSFAIDHAMTPNVSFTILSSSPRPVETMHELTTPVGYISSLPLSPWEGKNLHIRNQMNDSNQSRLAIRTGKIAEDDWIDKPDYTYSKFNPIYHTADKNDWILYSYGPTRVSSFKAYHPSNGLISIGSIYITARGVLSHGN